MQLTISEAAAHCGYKSRTVIYRLQRDGLLRDYEAGREGRSLLLESHPPGRCSLRDYIAACVQLRHDSPLAQRQRPAAATPVGELSDAEFTAYCDKHLNDAELAAYCDEHLSDAAMAAAVAPINEWADSQQAPDWDQVAVLANAALDCSAWGPPPWPGGRWATLAMVLSLAEEEAASHA